MRLTAITHLLLSIFIAIFAVNSVAYAVPAPKTGEEKRNFKLQIESHTPVTKNEIAETTTWAKNELAKADKSEIIVVEAENQVKPDEVPGLDTIASLIASPTTLIAHHTFPTTNWLDRHFRPTFTIVRGVLSGGFAHVSLIVSYHLPYEVTLPVAFATGLLAGGFQYYNQQFQDWLLKSKNPIGQYARWYVLEVINLSLIQGASMLAGVPHEPTITAEITTVLKTAVFSVLAQGPWDMMIAMHTKTALEKNPEKKDRIELWSDGGVFLTTIISTSAAVAKLFDVKYANHALITFGALGAVSWGHALWKRHQYNKNNCQKLLIEP